MGTTCLNKPRAWPMRESEASRNLPRLRGSGQGEKIRVTSWKWNAAMSLPSRGDCQGVYEPVIARLQQPSQAAAVPDRTGTIATWWGELKPRKNWIQHCEKRNRYDWKDVRPAWLKTANPGRSRNFLPFSKILFGTEQFQASLVGLFKQTAPFPHHMAGKSFLSSQGTLWFLQSFIILYNPTITLLSL